MTNVLELDSIAFGFPDGPALRHVLHGVDLAVSAGEMVAVMGPSGSGKSTLVNIACGLVAPTHGAVRINGEQPPPWSPPWWAERRRKAIGVIHQRHSLFAGLTVLENVALPLELDGVRRDVAAGDARDALAKVGIDRLAERKVRDLSVGQQQTVAIARGLVGGRNLLLADEPTAALDTTAAEAVVRLLGDAASNGCAVLLVTHDSRLASWADRIVRLRDGHIIEPTATDVASQHTEELQ